MNHVPKRHTKTHPQEHGNVLANVTFFPTLKLLKEGYRTKLRENDLYEVPSSLKSEKLAHNFEHRWQTYKKYGFFSVFCCYFGFCYLGLGLMKLLADTILIIIQPYLLEKMLSHLSSSQMSMILYFSLMIVFQLVQTIFNHNYRLFLTSFAIKVRTSLCSLLYKKILALNPVHLEKISLGKVITLITKDTQILDSFVHHGNELWVGIIKLMVVSYMLCKKSGPTCLGVTALYTVGIFLQGCIGENITILKQQTLEETEKRVQSTHEAFSKIKTVKKYGWESFLESKIINNRKNEMQKTYKIFVLKSFGLTISEIASKMVIYLFVMGFVWNQDTLPDRTMFFLFYILSESFGTQFPQAIYQTSELITTINRFGEIIKDLERHSQEEKTCTKSIPRVTFRRATLTLNNIEILNKINFKVEKRGIVLISGPIGCGKTLLLQALLGNFLPQRGKIIVEGRTSYAAQEPWIFPSTIRQNILFEENYDEARYLKVQKICALVEFNDSAIFSDCGQNFDKTLRTKINIARAIYKKSDIYLLDDCLTVFDREATGEILNFLGDKLVVLTTRDFGGAQKNPKIMFVEDLGGKTELRKDDKMTKLIVEKNSERSEEIRSGEVDFGVYRQYVGLGGGLTLFLMIFGVFVLVQLVVSYGDNLIEFWIYAEEAVLNNRGRVNSTVMKILYKEQEMTLKLSGVMTVTTAVIFWTSSITLWMFSRKVSLELHKKFLRRTLNASMEFFEMNFLGNILNRFSKDFAIIDEIIPCVIYELFHVALKFLGLLVLLAYVNILFLLPTVILIFILVMFRRCCLSTLRNLKRLEAAARSPILGHLTSTFEGLQTIKAYQAATKLRTEFEQHLDVHTSMSYTFEWTLEAFAFFSNIFCVIYTVILTLLVIAEGNKTPSLSLGITEAFILIKFLQEMIQKWTDLENQMIALERVLEYSEAPPKRKKSYQDEVKNSKMGFQNVCFEDERIYEV